MITASGDTVDDSIDNKPSPKNFLYHILFKSLTDKHLLPVTADDKVKIDKICLY